MSIYCREGYPVHVPWHGWKWKSHKRGDVKVYILQEYEPFNPHSYIIDIYKDEAKAEAECKKLIKRDGDFYSVRVMEVKE